MMGSGGAVISVRSGFRAVRLPGVGHKGGL